MTHFGISGPVALDISRFITTSAHRQRLSLTCDFLPAQSREQLTETWKQLNESDGKRPLLQSVSEMLPRRVAEHLLQEAAISVGRRFAELSRGDRDRLLTAIKTTEIPIAGNLGFKKAEAGGIALHEVDSKTLQSKRVPGLFLLGSCSTWTVPSGDTTSRRHSAPAGSPVNLSAERRSPPSILARVEQHPPDSPQPA